MSHRAPSVLGFFVYSALTGGTEYDWTDRLLEASLGTIEESIEEGLNEFVHGDLTLTLDDSDGVVSGLLLPLAPTAQWRAEMWRTPTSWELLWAGILDTAGGIERDERDQTVTLKVFAYSKRLEKASAETVKRTVTGVTGTATSGSNTCTVSDASKLTIDDEITLAQSGNKQTNKIKAISGTALSMVDQWSASYSAAPLTLETPYYRNKTRDFLVAQLFQAAGITTQQITLDALTVDDPFPARVNENGLTRTDVYCCTRRSGNLASFENGGSYQATSPTSGFTAASFTPTAPTDWVAYGGTEPGSFKDLAAPDVGTRIAGKQATYYWYPTLTSTPPTPPAVNQGEVLKIKRSDGTEVTVDTFSWNTEIYDLCRWVVDGFEYNIAESRVWITYHRENDGISQAPRAKAYTEALVLDSTKTIYGALRALSSNGLVSYTSTALSVYQNVSPYPLLKSLTHVPDLKIWTMRYGIFDAVEYVAAIQYTASAWRFILWRYTSGEIVLDVPITTGTPSGEPSMTHWYDSAGGDNVFWGFVPTVEDGGFYFYVTKAGADSIAYADFSGSSCGEALKDLATSSAAVLYVDKDNKGWFVGRSSLAAAFGATPTALSDLIEKHQRSVWQWYRNSVTITSTDTRTGEEIRETAGTATDSELREEIEAPYASTPGVARALAANFLAWLDRDSGELEVTIPEPASGYVKLFGIVTIGSTNYRVLRAETDVADREQQLLLVEE